MNGMKVKTAAWALLATTTLILCGCGGKASSSNTPAPLAPAPVAQNLVITTASLPNGTYGQFFNANLQASGGTPPYTWLVVSGDPLSGGLSLNQNTGAIDGVLTSNLTFTVAVADAKLRSASHDFAIKANPGATKLMTTVLPPATVQRPYDVFLAISVPGNNGQFKLASGALPTGINLSSAGELSGTPTSTGTFSFAVEVAANGSKDHRALTLKVNTHTSRNETAQTATPISNGTWMASISPYADPLDAPNPDNDFYSFSATGGSAVSVNIFAQRLNPSSPLQPVLEILDSSGNRLQTCTQAGDTDFVDDCMSDQILPEFSSDAMLTFKPAASGNFFIHVLDFRGDARPDMVYQMGIFGAN